MVILFIGLLLLATTVGLMAWGFALPRARVNARVREMDTYGFSGNAAPVAEEHRSPLRDLANRIGAAVGNLFGGRYEARIKRDLMTAGMYSAKPRSIMGAQVMSALVVAGLIVALDIGNSPIGRLAALAFACAIGWGIPWLLVYNKGLKRRDRIDRKVPDLIDMLVVTIEAGLGFAASVQAASIRIKGPLGEELRLTMKEQEMGVTLRDALMHSADRTTSRSMGSFVRAVTQGEALGVSIGTVMRNIAAEMRLRRRQEAEERAQKAPVKMLFPLIFLMFPALMIVILGPAMIEIFRTLGSM
jgi:tight adherence protein C